MDNYEALKSDIEKLYSDWSTIQLDLYKMNVNSQDVLNFSSDLDIATAAIKSEDKAKTLTSLAKLYSYIPTYASASNQDTLVSNVYKTKSNLLTAYSVVEQDDFAKVELKVGEILESKRHENAEKLLVSKIKIGDEVRQIVSGIAKHYDPQTLIGRKVIVVTNLLPVKIRGVESNGMVLCAADGEKLELIEIKEVNSGCIVR